MPGHVFLSYSREDRGYVDALVEHFRDGGVEVWADHEIDYGTRWLTVIRDRIDECAAFVLVMTPKAEASRWVAEEVHRATEQDKPILPLLLDGRPFFGLTGTQYHSVIGGQMPRPDFVNFLRTVADGTAPLNTARPSLSSRSLFAHAVVAPPPPGVLGRLAHTLAGKHGTALAQAWAPDARLATGHVARAAQVWRPADEAPTHSLKTPAAVTSLAWSPGGDRLALGLDDGDVHLRVPVVEAEPDQPLAAEPVTVLRGHTNTVLAVSWSTSGSRIATGSRDRGVRIWDAGTGLAAGPPLAGHRDTVAAVAWSPDGRRLATADFDGSVLIWDFARDPAGSVRWSLHDTAGIPSLAWSPDGARLLTGSEGPAARIWALADDGQLNRVLAGHTAPVWTVAWSPDGRTVATGSFDGTVSIWDPDSGDRLLMLDDPREEVNAVGFAPDGRQVAAASDDGVVRVWEL